MSLEIAAPARRGLPDALARSLREHQWFIHFVLVYLAACIAAASLLGAGERLNISFYTGGMLLVTVAFFAAFFVGYPVYVMLFVRPERLIKHLIDGFRGQYLTADRLLAALPVFLLIPIFISSFSSFKTMIPLMHPFDWDPTFVAWDKALHGGRHPWELLQPLLGTPFITSTINFFYNSWFFLIYGILFWQAFSRRDPKLRMRFFMSFLLTWSLLGTVAATLLASVGPCFYGRLTGLEDPFAPLMAYLNAANEHYPIWSLTIQEMLWERFTTGSSAIGSGISAMPSLHVAVAFLFAFFCWQVNRGLGIALYLFAGIILLGSVHLGWHYAIDGYLSIIGAWAIWRGTGWALSRWGEHGTPATA